jgi:hypothetical protein
MKKLEFMDLFRPPEFEDTEDLMGFSSVGSNYFWIVTKEVW